MPARTARLGLAALALLLAAPARARVTPPAGSGLELGLRVGVEVPTGTSVKSSRIDMSLIVGKALPLWAELGWRFSESLSVSATYQVGFGFIDGCDLNATCGARDDRFAVHATWRFTTEGVADPWLSAGAGYEWFRLTERGAYQANLTVKGPVMADLQAGIDFIPARGWVAGPFLSFAIGKFSSASGTILGQAVAVTYPESNRSRHHWSQLGFRTLCSF
jgi:hypothetical protein